MAKAKPIMAAAISGALGSIEFQNTRGGQLVKQRRRRSAPTTPAARAAQSRLGAVVHAWHSLSAAARQTWYAARSTNVLFGRLQGVRTPDAMALFITAQPDTTLTTNKAYLQVPPVFQTEPPATVTLTLSASGSYTITTTRVPDSHRPAWETVRLARFLPHSPEPIVRTWMTIGTYDYVASSRNWQPRFYAQSIALLEGERIAVSVSWQNETGWLSLPLVTYSTVLG